MLKSFCVSGYGSIKDKISIVNELYNIFLSYKNFKTFLLAHFLPKSTNLVNALHKNGTDDIKNDKDILRFSI